MALLSLSCRRGHLIGVLAAAGFVLSYPSARPAQAQVNPSPEPTQTSTVPSADTAAPPGEDAPSGSDGEPSREQPTAPKKSRPTTSVVNARQPDQRTGATEPGQSLPGISSTTPRSTAGLPTGADKSGVTSQSISIPKGSGTIEGMGESFSAQLSTGVATFSVPFALPKARGAAQPSLGLSYSSANGAGVAGIGWQVGVPFIARQTDRGTPKYVDDASGWQPEQDRFVFNGGQELVPICTVGGDLSCTGDPTAPPSPALQPTTLPDGTPVTERMPDWAAGWQYFRPRVEGSFLRFFWSPNHRTWRVQDKSGITMELGVPLDNTSYESAIETNPYQPSQIYRWHLVRQYDTYGDANVSGFISEPHNMVVYRYFQDAGTAYLSDIFDTSPAANPKSATLDGFAHHTRLSYEVRPDPTFSFRSGWRMDQRLRLVGVEVASKTSTGIGSARKLVRRYHLGYQSLLHASLLARVQIEGRCSGTEESAPEETPGIPPAPWSPINIPDLGRQTEGTGYFQSTVSCSLLPVSMDFAYTEVAGFDTNHVPSSAHLTDAQGLAYDPFDATINHLAESGSPKYSIDEELTDLFDVNSDGLPDVVVTAPALFGGKHGLFLNGANGQIAFSSTTMGVRVDPLSASHPDAAAVAQVDSNVLKLSNANVNPLDLDANGTVDLVHMPRVKKYEIFRPQWDDGWWWSGRPIATSDGQDPKIDFTKDASRVRVADVNADGLVDLVMTTGTEIETFFSLGRYRRGDGQFGHASWLTASQAVLSTDPVRHCLPWSATPIQFSDTDVYLGDMNGDGLVDIVRIRPGDIRYWPGRGNGFWGTGIRDDCPTGNMGEGRHIAMATSPQYGMAEDHGLLLDDVNGDGLDDLVEVRFNAVDVYLNVDGTAWTNRQVLSDTPPRPASSNRVRLVDLNGSGTRDLMWGDGYDYKYIDLQGGRKPRLLRRVSNGLGKITEIAYSTSTAEMLAAEPKPACNGTPSVSDPWSTAWCTKMPTVAQVVKSVTEQNAAVDAQGVVQVVTSPPQVTVYEYRDPVYEGRQREFRGFSLARAKRMGDANSPTDTTDTRFLLGQCVDETQDNVDDCSDLSLENPREALKGLPYLTEKSDDQGRYVSSAITGYSLRTLYRGLDGRLVRHAFAGYTRTLPYDTGPFRPSNATAPQSIVTVDGSHDLGWTEPVPLRGEGYGDLLIINTVDLFGNKTSELDAGCINCPPSENELIQTDTWPAPVPGDPTGWLWRTVTTRVIGFDHGERNHTRTVYDSHGQPVETWAVLTGSIALERTNGGTMPPPAASTGGEILTGTNQYDPNLGILTRQTGPNGRCRDLGFDQEYASIPSYEIVYRGGCEVSGLGTTVDTFDRGLGLATQITNMQGQPTAMQYDEFGRLVELTAPHPNVVGALSPLPTVHIDYYLATPDQPYSIIHTRNQDGPTVDDDSYLESYSYVDGFGRALASLSEGDPSAGEGAWIAGSQVTYDAKGAVSRKYLEYYTDENPFIFVPYAAPAERYGRQRYDAFGRQVQTFDLDGTVTLQSVYHALSTDLWDGADIAPGPHQGTYATTRKNGHGRVVDVTERAHASGGGVEERHVLTTYLPTGEPEIITRQRGADQVVRWMKYDTLGRMVLNVEPNTSENLPPSPTNPSDIPLDTTGIKAWRYAYNDAGDLVGTSDARGCGQNFFYDAAGRLLGEDYSPCEPHHAAYTAPVLDAAGKPTVTGDGLEVLYQYDFVPAAANWMTPPADWNHHQFNLGRLVATYDRGAVNFVGYDGRGRLVEHAKRVALPLEIPLFTTLHYGARWYRQGTGYDAADREVVTTTGAGCPTPGAGCPQELLGIANQSLVLTDYGTSGRVKRVASTYGDLVTSIRRLADGRIDQITYGDAAATSTAYSYDDRRRVRNVLTYRAAAGIWQTPPTEPGHEYLPAPTYGAAPSTFQLLLQDDDLTYDVVGNPLEIRDNRVPEEWPETAQPVTRKAEYDDLYRVSKVSYQYPAGQDSWKSPFATEIAELQNGGYIHDLRRVRPSSHRSFDKRVLSQTFEYDWLGNTSKTGDDANGFYDRSLGTVTNDSAKPYQLQGAALAAPATGGHVTTQYDAAGNLTRLDVERRGPCLLATDCSMRFAYQWDEVGRLTRARRWDVTAASLANPLNENYPAAIDLRYTYDASDQRVVKNAGESSTVYIFGSLELRRAMLADTDDWVDYELTDMTEVPYLYAHGVRLARVVWQEPSGDQALPKVGSPTPGQHVLFELGDHLGSSAVVLDKDTGELVERTSFYAYGATEGDYRPDRWKGFREDYKFTGKEEDVEVGLQYFGKRYLNPFLGRWVSADPLTVHVPGKADWNLYAYVSGMVLKAVDPVGLGEENGDYSIIPGGQEAQQDYNDLMEAPRGPDEYYYGPSWSFSPAWDTRPAWQMQLGFGTDVARYAIGAWGSSDRRDEAFLREAITGEPAPPPPAPMSEATLEDLGKGFANGLMRGNAAVALLEASGPNAPHKRIFNDIPEAYDISGMLAVGLLEGAGLAAVSGSRAVTLTMPEIGSGLRFGAHGAEAGAAVEGMEGIRAAERILYHYTSYPEESFAAGMWKGTYVTDNPALSAFEARYLGIKGPLPDKVIPVIARQGAFAGGNEITGGLPGMREWWSLQPIPPSDILSAITISLP